MKDIYFYYILVLLCYEGEGGQGGQRGRTSVKEKKVLNKEQQKKYNKIKNF